MYKRGEKMETGFETFLKNEYFFMRSDRLAGIRQAYDKIIDYKTNAMMAHLFDQPVDVGLIPAITEEEYTELFFAQYKKVIGTATAKSKEASDFLDSFTTREILNNKTEHDIIIGGRKYQKGTKAYRLIRKFGRERELHIYFENKMFDSLKLQEEKVKDIYLSVRPEHFLQAAEFGDSCFSVEGSHEDSALIYPTLPYSMVAYTPDNSWRAFVYFSADRKFFTQMPGYPRENFYAQVAIKKYFEDKGYQYISQYLFNHGAYQDLDIFHGPISEIRGKDRVVVNKYLDIDLYLGTPVKDTDYKNIIAAYCDRCDSVYIGEHTFDDGLCENCWIEQ